VEPHHGTRALPRFVDSKLVGGFLGAVCAGLVATAAYLLVSWLWQQWRYRRKLGPYAGRFQAQWKYQDKTEPGTLVINVRRNRLLVAVSDIEHPYEGQS